MGYRVEFLEEANISSKDKQIYLIGHGSSKNLTIGGRSIDDIAELLIKVGYKENQRIYITSCYSAVSNKYGINMVNDLKWWLKEKLTSKEALYKSYNFNIESDADGAAVYVEKDSNVEMWVIPPDKSTILDTCTQSSFIFANGYIYKKLPSNFKNLIGNVNNFKKGLINSKRERRVFMCIDGSDYYGVATTLFSPLLTFIANSMIASICSVFKTNISIEVIIKFMIFEAILFVVSFGIQWGKNPKDFLSLFLYKGCLTGFMVHSAALFLAKFEFTSSIILNDILVMIASIAAVSWVIGLILMNIIKHLING